MGAIEYADDLTLICPSIRGINKMVQICSEFGQNHGLKFNNTKSMGFKFGNKIDEEKQF